MTNYIEEMMRTAEVKKEEVRTPGRDWDYEGLASEYVDYVYPDFTPEKQLEMIKLIGTLDNICTTKRIYNGNWCITTVKRIGEEIDFSQALAQLTTELMKAGELNREKVKEILE